MYPLLRMTGVIIANRSAPPLALGEMHVSRHVIMPWDIDVFLELNNGRTLTLFDLGRTALFIRTGFPSVARKHGWSGAVAGTSVRYRQRIRAFDRVEMRSRIVGWDARFFYSEQSLWRRGTCCSHALLRLVVTGQNGIVAPSIAARAMGYPSDSPPLPDWVAAWSDAERTRPWPPMPDDLLRDTFRSLSA